MKKFILFLIVSSFAIATAGAQTTRLDFVPVSVCNDSVVIKAMMAPTGGSYRFDGVSVCIAYDPGVFYIDTITSIMNKYFAQYDWEDNSLPNLEMNGLKPDIMMYEQNITGPGQDRLVGQNQFIKLCTFTFYTWVKDSGTTSFDVYGNFDTGAFTYYTVTTDAETHKFSPVKVLSDFWYPVELTSFTAAQQGHGVALTWYTATEHDNAGFDIQRRSLDGSDNPDWRTIGNVRGSGTTIQQRQYFFFDNSLSKDGMYEYRLVQRDYDGRETELRPVQVNYRNSTFQFALNNSYPNPVSLSSGAPASISYEIPERSRVKLIATNLLGQQVAEFTDMTLEAGRYTATWLPSDFTAGTYIVILTTVSETSGKAQRASIHLNVVK
jgi:hypothetical protein